MLSKLMRRIRKVTGLLLFLNLLVVSDDYSALGWLLTLLPVYTLTARKTVNILQCQLVLLNSVINKIHIQKYTGNT